MTSARLQVRIAQFSPGLGDVPRNLERMLEIAKEAASDGVDLLLFPELALTGYALRDLVPECAVGLDSPEIAALSDASREVSIAFGFVEESPEHLFFNSAAFLEGGEIRHVHRKVHLPTYGLFEEGRYFAAGESVRAFPTRLGRLALLVCEDVWHLPIPYLAALDGAHAILILAASPMRGVGDGGKANNTLGWEQLLVTYATSLTVFVAFANRSGFEDGVGFWGGSEILGPTGGSVAKAAYHEDDFVTAPLDLDEVRRERIHTPLLRDERIPLVVSELQRILAARRSEPVSLDRRAEELTDKRRP